MNDRQVTSYRRQAVERFFQHKLAAGALVLLAVEIVLILVLPSALHLDPYTTDRAAFGAAPDAIHILGTDTTGRDVFARLIFGGRVSIFVGVFSTLVSVVIGVPLGAAAGYFRGPAETVIMRATDIFMSFPAIVLILVAVAVIGPSVWSVSIIIGILGWTEFSRVIYSKVLSVAKEDYVEAARAIGAGKYRILFSYILPNSLTPALVSASFKMAGSILMESSLSFLGMGVQPPEASWGNMIHEAQSVAVLIGKPWMWAPAGIAILVTILAINFIGDGLRDALDPKVNI